MRQTLLLALVLLAVVAGPAAADDDRTHFRRTTPRASLEEEAGTFALGVPSGRAWGIESELRPLPAERALAVRLVVSDDLVREAFARVAYYASATGRPRQIAIVDARAVRDGEHAALVVPLDAPPGAIAYRVRVLARLSAAETRSSPGAVRARLGSGRDRDAHARPYSRLRGEVP